MDENKIESFQERLFVELNAGMSCLTLQLGYRLGLIQALAAVGPMTPSELAQQTGYIQFYHLTL